MLVMVGTGWPSDGDVSLHSSLAVAVLLHAVGPRDRPPSMHMAQK